MNKRMLYMLIAVLVFVSAIGFFKFKQIQTAIAQGKAFTMPPEAVTSVVVRPQQWEATIEATGSVEPVQGVVLSADQPGVVDAIHFQSGSYVKAGQVLVALDTKQERAQLASAEARRELSRTNLERSKKLLENNVIAQAEFDQIAALAKQAEAAVVEIQAAIDRKTIRAPFSGRAGIREVNVGQYVHSGDPIVPLQSEAPIYVNFSVPQQQAATLKVGSTVYAAADSGAKARVAGRITAINAQVDEVTRNVEVQATFDNRARTLRPGAYATVEVVTGRQAAVVAIPASAVNYAPYGNSVFIIEDMKGPDGKSYKGVRQQFVKLGPARGDQVAVLSGVKDGDEIATSGVFKLRPNAAVQVNNAVQPSNSANPQPADS